MKRVLCLAAATAFLACLSAPAMADPIITPLVAAGLSALLPEIAGIGGVLTIGGVEAAGVLSSALVRGGLFQAEGLLSKKRRDR